MEIEKKELIVNDLGEFQNNNIPDEYKLSKEGKQEIKRIEDSIITHFKGKNGENCKK